MKLNRLIRKRRHPAAAFVTDHGALLAGIAGSAALAYVANRARKNRPKIVERVTSASRDLRDRASGLVDSARDRFSRDRDSDALDETESPAIARANGTYNRLESTAT